MEQDEHEDDVRAIKALVARQFASLNWVPGTSADWAAFAADFFPGAPLHPAARPARTQTVDEFVDRLKGLVGTRLHSFHETVLGTEVRVFGNVAVAVAACEMTENGSQVSRGVEMLLLVRNDGIWQIAAQAWDADGPTKPIPDHLLRKSI